MKPQRWARIRPILEEAWSRPPEEREAWVRAHCNDASLVDDVLACLSADDDDPTFLEPPSIDAAEPGVEAAFVAGTRLGPWRLTQHLAQGGMGTVWEAERDDGAFAMTVAVKVLRAGLTTDALRRRFHDERELLARLDHPSIVRLLDGGTHEDVPYLVMERVDGTAIDAWCDARALDVDARLALMLDVFDAVAHAHGALVVHRDIKPNNVLVDAEGRPRLVDFGISTSAGAPSEGGLTSSPLTPRYASPEQLRDEPVTTSSDVFALGVLLFELLTGTTAHPPGARAPDAAARTASIATLDGVEAADRAARRSTTADALSRRLRGDLDAILACALAVDPSERYATVVALADDVRRHLTHHVVTARGAVPGLALARLVRRHPIASGAVTLASAVLIGATVTVTHLYLEAEDARRDAEAAQQQAEQSADVARRRFDDVRALASALVFDLHDEIVAIPGATRARAALIDTSLRYLDGLAEEADDDMTLLADVGTAYRRLGDVEGATTAANLGDPDAARAAYERLVALRERLAANTTGAERRQALLGLVSARRLVASIAERQGDVESAFAQLEAAGADLATLQEEFGAFDERDVAERALTIDLGDAFVHAGRDEDAIERFEAVLPAARAAADGKAPASIEKEDLSALLDKLGNALQRANRLDEAEALLRESLAISRAAVALDGADLDSRRRLTYAEQVLAEVLVSDYRFDEALALQTEVMTRLREAVAADPADAYARRELYRHFAHMSRGLTLSGRRDDALAFVEQALSLALDVVEQQPDDVEARRDAAQYAAEVSGILWRVGRHDDAQAQARRALDLAAEVLAVDPNDTTARHMRISAYHDLSTSAFLTGDPAASLEYATQSSSLAVEASEAAPRQRWPNRMRFICRLMLGDAHLALARETDDASERRAHAQASVAAYERAFAWYEEVDARGLLLPSDDDVKGFAEQNLRDARALVDEALGEP